MFAECVLRTFFLSSIPLYLFPTAHSLRSFFPSVVEWIFVLYRILMYKYYKCPAVYHTNCTSNTCHTYASVSFCMLRSHSTHFLFIGSPVNSNMKLMHKNVSTLVYVKFIILLKFYKHTLTSTQTTLIDVIAYLTSSFFTFLYIRFRIKHKKRWAHPKPNQNITNIHARKKHE